MPLQLIVYTPSSALDRWIYIFILLRGFRNYGIVAELQIYLKVNMQIGIPRDKYDCSEDKHAHGKQSVLSLYRRDRKPSPTGQEMHLETELKQPDVYCLFPLILITERKMEQNKRWIMRDVILQTQRPVLLLLHFSSDCVCLRSRMNFNYLLMKNKVSSAPYAGLICLYRCLFSTVSR